MSSGGFFSILAAAVLSVTVVASTARAEDDPEVLIRDGVSLRRSGDDAKAYGYLKHAYEIAHTPRTAAQLGLVEQALGRFLESQQHLSEALDGNDAWVDQNRALLEKSRESVRQHLGKIELHGLPPGTVVGISGQPPVPVPKDGALWVPPGMVKLALSAPDRTSVSKEAVASAGMSVVLEVDFPLAAPAPGAETVTRQAATETTSAAATVTTTPATGPDDKNRTLRIAGLVTAGAGVLVGVSGVFVYHSGTSKRDAIERNAKAGLPYDPSNGDYQTLTDTGIALMIAGGAAVATGAVLYLLGREAKTSTETHVSLGYLPGAGGHILIGGRF
jgi:hypothetical protein